MKHAAPSPTETLVLVLQDPSNPGGQDTGPPVRRGDAPPGTTPGVATQGDPAGTGGPPGEQQSMQQACLDQLPILIGFVAIFYFLILRPSQKQEKKRKALLGAIKKGDQVVTNSGIHGSITSLDDNTVTLRVDQNVELKFDRVAIGRVQADDEAASGGNGD